MMNKVLKLSKKNGNNIYTSDDLRTYDKIFFKRVLDGVSKTDDHYMEHSMNQIGENKQTISLTALKF